jgi:hypothetical protein
MIRIFIGTSPNGEDAEANAVLEYTLRTKSSDDLDITWLKLNASSLHPLSGWRTDRFNTPFSGLRWAIPELCGFEGKAIYMDTDIFVLGNIAELWNQSFQGKAILVQNPTYSTSRSCVALLHCGRMGKIVPSIRQLKKMRNQQSYCANLLNDSNIGRFSGLWNCVDLKGSTLDDPNLKAVHYSSIAHQLHLKYAIPRLEKSRRKHWYDGEVFPHWRPELIELFDQLLSEAVEYGYHPKNYDPGFDVCPYNMRSYKNVRVKGFSK